MAAAAVVRRVRRGGRRPRRESMAGPQLVLGPMVGLSELPFRLLCRRYGADCCWCAMLMIR